MKVLKAFCIALLLATAQVHAETTVQEYRKIKAANGDDWKAMIVYIVGITEGLSWANAFNDMNHWPKIFCPPPKLHMTGALDITILENEMERDKSNPQSMGLESKIEPMLMYGLVHAYPCN